MGDWLFNIRKVLVICSLLCWGCLGCGNRKQEEMISNEEEIAMKDEYNLTDKEKELLIRIFGNEENINNNKLYDYQIEALNQLRTGEDYLVQKYPSHKFEITHFENATKLTNQAISNYVDEYGRSFTVTITPENGEYVCRDTYYGIAIQERYDREIEQFLSEAEITAKAYTDFPMPAGFEADETASLSSINEIEPKITRCTHIYVDDLEKSSEIYEKAKKILESNHAYGSYILYYVPSFETLSIEELEQNRQNYESVSFNCFNV